MRTSVPFPKPGSVSTKYSALLMIWAHSCIDINKHTEIIICVMIFMIQLFLIICFCADGNSKCIGSGCCRRCQFIDAGHICNA